MIEQRAKLSVIREMLAGLRLEERFLEELLGESRGERCVPVSMLEGILPFVKLAASQGLPNAGYYSELICSMLWEGEK
jgi:hypothetical protein